MSALLNVKDDPKTSVDVPSVEELVARARAMIPVLRKRGAESDGLRRLHPDTLADFVEARFHMIGVPREFGGMGYGQDVCCKVGVEIAQGDGTAGWLAVFYAAHNMLFGMFPLKAQEDVWASGKTVLTSTISTGGMLNYEPVEGGFKVNGLVRFSSGIDAANWLIVIGPKGLFMFPKSDFEIVDDWHVMGMKGTGSKGAKITDAFVPEHRIVPPEVLHTGTNYGALHYDAVHYSLPFEVWSRTSQTSAILGMAIGLRDLYDDRIRGRTDAQTGRPAIERPGWQTRFAEATAEIEAAKSLFETLHADMRRWHAEGGEVSSEERARVRLNIVYVAKLCLQAADRLFDGGDASAVYESNPIQRFYRDIRVAGVSISQVFDEPALQYSRVHWGLPTETFW